MDTNWLSYSLTDFLMFGPEVFLRLFVRINQDIWPWQGVAVIMMVAIGALFLEPWGEPMRYAGLALIWLAAALTVVTGWDYFRRGLASSAMRGES